MSSKMDLIEIVGAGHGSTTPIIIGFTLLLIFFAYRWALPKPFPGIPYHKRSATSIFGDIPSMVSHISKTGGDVCGWLATHNRSLNSPIVQIFVTMFGKPWILIADFREGQDILMRRTKEFDRSDYVIDIFSTMTPEHHIVLKTDERYKMHRRLLQDLMSPPFLQNVAAPQIHSSMLNLVRLWQEKARLSGGHPFSAATDIYHAALEAVWVTTFGLSSSATITRNQVDRLSSLAEAGPPENLDDEIVFPYTPIPEDYQCILTLGDSLEYAIQSPFPKLMHRLVLTKPAMRAALRHKDQMITSEIEKAKERMMGQEKTDEGVNAAIDHMLRREFTAAEKENRAPQYNTKVMIDEVHGFLVAGHDTSATALTWALKFLTTHQDIQARLRAVLHARLASAKTQNRFPTSHEILKTQIHYLDACMEEIFRCSLTEAQVSRTSTVDTTILGRPIPKGTTVFILGNGASFFEPAFEIDNSLRSKTALDAEGRVGAWDPVGIDKFSPDRWLVKTEDEEERVFDSTAGPHLTFGLGPRGCFGRRLAYAEMRLALVLILWSFELQPVPEKFSGMESTDGLTHRPKYTYLRLRKL